MAFKKGDSAGWLSTGRILQQPHRQWVQFIQEYCFVYSKKNCTEKTVGYFVKDYV